jgi:hypothetical protein
MPYERFVILLKSRSRTHHPQIHYSYIGGRRRTCILDPPKNALVLHWEKTPKIFYIGFHQINAPNSCAIPQIFSLQKRGMGYAKVIQRKNLKK